MRTLKFYKIPDCEIEKNERVKIQECNKPHRLPTGYTPSSAAEHYKKCAQHAMDEWQVHKAGIYFEWAILELEKANGNG